LQTFVRKLTAARRETFSHRIGDHDDLLLAVAYAAWMGEGGLRRLAVFC